MAKFYRVKQNTFMWEKGAILQFDSSLCSDGGYRSMNEIWNNDALDSEEYISAPLIEKNPEWFERVYPVNLVKKTVYKLKAQAKELINKEFEE